MTIKFKRVAKHDPGHVNYQAKINGTPIRVKIPNGALADRFEKDRASLASYLKTMLFAEVDVEV